MPIYDYECSACGHRLEALQKFSDAPLTECPACHQPALRKQLSAPSFHLKGSGWYQTDFKNAGQKKPADAAKPEAAEPAKAADDATPAAASAPKPAAAAGSDTTT